MPSIPLSNLESVLTSTDKAKGLPNEHYVSQAVFEEEKKAVLFDNWSAIGFGKDIPNTGDVKPIDFVGMPVIMVRDTNNNINVRFRAGECRSYPCAHLYVFSFFCRHTSDVPVLDSPSSPLFVIIRPVHLRMVRAQD